MTLIYTMNSIKIKSGACVCVYCVLLLLYKIECWFHGLVFFCCPVNRKSLECSLSLSLKMDKSKIWWYALVHKSVVCSGFLLFLACLLYYDRIYYGVPFVERNVSSSKMNNCKPEMKSSSIFFLSNGSARRRQKGKSQFHVKNKPNIYNEWKLCENKMVALQLDHRFIFSLKCFFGHHSNPMDVVHWAIILKEITCCQWS